MPGLGWMVQGVSEEPSEIVEGLRPLMIGMFPWWDVGQYLAGNRLVAESFFQYLAKPEHI